MKIKLLSIIAGIGLALVIPTSFAQPSIVTVATQDWTLSTCSWVTNWAGNGVSSKNLNCWLYGGVVANKFETPSGCSITLYSPPAFPGPQGWSSPCNYVINVYSL